MIPTSSKQANPFVIAISGISGAGKSTLTSKLANTLKATALFWDEYDDISTGPEDYVKWYETSKNYDDWVYDDLANTLKKLKEGQKVICPATKRELFPTKYIIFDAPLGYCHTATGKYIDFLVCVDAPLDIALARRLIRDSRNQPEAYNIIEELEFYLSHSRPLFILTPEERECDLLLDGALSLDELQQRILNTLQNICKS